MKSLEKYESSYVINCQRSVEQETHRLQRYKIWVTLLMLNAKSCPSFEEISYTTGFSFSEIDQIKNIYEEKEEYQKYKIRSNGPGKKDELEEIRKIIFKCR